MGLLDDAIREHLELKRKHGAGDEELRRQETEALGPARRDFAAAEPGADEAAPPPVAAEDPTAAETAPAEPRGWLDDDELAQTRVAEPPAPDEPIEHAAEAADPALAQEPVAAADPAPAPPVEIDEEEPFAPPPPPTPQRQRDTPTEPFDALSADEEQEDGEDVLEETPEFLQDTPEHDRLWFEQKPPRDFDFDG